MTRIRPSLSYVNERAVSATVVAEVFRRASNVKERARLRSSSRAAGSTIYDPRKPIASDDERDLEGPSPSVTDLPEVRIVRAGRERIPDLEPLFGALHDHQVRVAPTLTNFENRSADEAWLRRRAKYEKWLGEPGAFVLLAEGGGRAVGYALVSLGGGYDSWHSPERIGDVHDLAVLPDARGRGIGMMLMDAVEDELRSVGVTHCRLRVIARNHDAIEFYERRGMSRVSTIFLQPIGRERGEAGT